MDDRYISIIDLPAHVSASRPRMPVSNRAVQFAPFAALTGFGALITEEARTTDDFVPPDDEERRSIAELLRTLSEDPAAVDAVTVRWFVRDARKQGGSWRTASGRVQRVNLFERVILLADGTSIPLDAVAALEEATD